MSLKWCHGLTSFTRRGGRRGERESVKIDNASKLSLPVAAKSHEPSLMAPIIFLSPPPSALRVSSQMSRS